MINRPKTTVYAENIIIITKISDFPISATRYAYERNNWYIYVFAR